MRLFHTILFAFAFQGVSPQALAAVENSCPSFHLPPTLKNMKVDDPGETVPETDSGESYRVLVHDDNDQDVFLFYVCMDGKWDLRSQPADGNPPEENNRTEEPPVDPDDEPGISKKGNQQQTELPPPKPEDLAYLHYLNGVRNLGSLKELPVPSNGEAEPTSTTLGSASLGFDGASSPMIGFSNAFAICERVRKSGTLGNPQDCSVKDGSFLERGPANQIASAFEKDTGLTRTEALAIFNNVATEKSSGGQSQFDSALKPAQALIKAVPNQGFRERAQKAMEQLPAEEKAKKSAEVVADLDRAPASASESAPIAAPAATKASGAPQFSTFPGSQASPGAGGGPHAVRDPGFNKFGSSRKAAEKDKLQKRELEELQGMLASRAERSGQHVQAAKEDPSADLSLFSRVSAHYRRKTPLFQKQGLPLR